MPSVQITPIGKFTPLPDLASIIRKEISKEIKAVRREYQITVRTWKRKPDFEVTETLEEAEVSTDNPIYGYVDKGTKPHVIRPKQAKTLRFNTAGFVSKTVAGRLTPRQGRTAKPPTAYPVEVHHPGTEARGFSALIAKRSQRRLTQAINKAIRLAVQRKKT
jgi:hypothetical protein